MNLFTVNQVNQVYVVKASSAIKSGSAAYNPVKGSGDVYCGVAPKASGIANEKSIYFKHAGPAGVTRSDIIDVNKIMSVKVTPAEVMAKSLKQYVLTDGSNTSASYVWPALDSTGTYMKAGYDFILRITLNNYVGISPEDAQYWKYAMVHTGPNMTPNAFWKEMAKSLLRNMSREATKFITVHGTTDGNTAGTELTLNNFDATWSNSNKGIIIREAEPDWVLGLKQQKVVGIEVTPVAFEADRATDDGTIVYWGYSNDNNIQTYDHKLEAVDSGVTIPNGKLTADYEYFFHGERGDQYRMMGWPDYIPTEYMVDPTKTYDYLQIHYSYIGSNESCQKSEKDITFVVETGGGTPPISNLESFLESVLPESVAVEIVGE
jgi:hypothetical protein